MDQPRKGTGRDSSTSVQKRIACYDQRASRRAIDQYINDYASVRPSGTNASASVAQIPPGVAKAAAVAKSQNSQMKGSSSRPYDKMFIASLKDEEKRQSKGSSIEHGLVAYTKQSI